MNSPGESLLRRHPLATYFGIAYGITWALVSPLALARAGALAMDVPGYWHAAGAAGPLAAAYIVTRASGGPATVRAWLAGFRHWRVGFRWWALAVGSPLLLLVGSCVLVKIAGGSWPDLARLSSPEYRNLGWLVDVLLVGSFAYALGEEPGWRGFALPRLEARHGPLVATLILTPLWALWHWPFFLYRPAYLGGPPAIAGFVFGLLAGAVVLTFLYDGTRGSLPAVIFWHALINVAMQIAAVMSQPALATMNVLVAIAAVAIVAWWLLRPPPRPQSRDPRSRPLVVSRRGSAPA